MRPRYLAVVLLVLATLVTLRLVRLGEYPHAALALLLGAAALWLERRLARIEARIDRVLTTSAASVTEAAEALYARMQTPEGRAAAERAFGAMTPETLGRAAQRTARETAED